MILLLLGGEEYRRRDLFGYSPIISEQNIAESLVTLWLRDGFDFDSQLVRVVNMLTDPVSFLAVFLPESIMPEHRDSFLVPSISFFGWEQV